VRWGDWTFPELADLPANERQQIERISGFLAAWDWRTLLTLPIVLAGIWLVSVLAPAEEDRERAVWTSAVAATLGLILFLVTLLVRMRHHARYIAARWKGKQAANAERFPPGESRGGACAGKQSLAGWQKVLYKIGLLAGPSAILVGVFQHWWTLAGLGAIVFIVGVGMATTYTVCVACRHLQLQFGVRLAHCPKCGASYYAG
jgi:hypothetical protein